MTSPCNAAQASARRMLPRSMLRRPSQHRPHVLVALQQLLRRARRQVEQRSGAECDRQRHEAQAGNRRSAAACPAWSGRVRRSPASRTRPPTRAPSTSASAVRRPARCLRPSRRLQRTCPSRIASLPRKPDSGGTPASEKIGTIARTVNSGCSRYSPPSARHVGGAAQPQQHAAHQEEIGDDDDVVQDVEDGPGQCRRRQEARLAVV